MIPAEQLIEIGRFGKPHGIKGEMSAVIPDTDIDPSDLSCVFVELDGLMVPFFIVSWRTKGAESVLLTFEGIDSQEKAALFTNKAIFAQPEDLPETERDAEGFFLDDLTGYTIESDGVRIGVISDFDDSTDNYLFIVTADDGSEILVPANPDLILEVDTDSETIYMNLPAGLINL